MQTLPQMVSNGKELGYTGRINLEYWQDTFGLNELIQLLVNDTSNYTGHTNAYNYILDNQKELLDKILPTCVEAWNEWIIQSPRAKSYEDLPPIHSADDIIRLFCPFYIDMDDESSDGFPTGFLFEPRAGSLEMFSQLYLMVKTNKSDIIGFKLELDNIPYIPRKYRTEKEEKWHNSN